ncbi:MAG TPA: acyl-CoA dehydrogenase family protein [Thermoanaerobaculia bacterium]|nr:acyl-CoA dehydrogenase family protein [Thermoanaerobaculia bacterium]
MSRSFINHEFSPAEIFTREDLSSAQQMLGSIAEDFMRTEVLPREERIYAKEWSVTRELLRIAGELDLLRIDIPEAYGGLGLDKVSSAFLGEKIGIFPSFAGSLGAHTTIGTLPLVYFGTPEQKERYLPKLATGELVAAFCLTEPGSGSDALAARTKAVRDGDHYILNGSKMWITNGGFADLFTIFAKVDGEKFTAFLVEREMGVVSGREEPKLGLDGSSTTALVLDDVRVPAGNVLGTIGEGHKVAFNVLNIGRLKLGTRNMGSAKQALDRALEYARQRHQFGRPIASFGMIRGKFAEMAIRIFVGDSMAYRTLGDADRALEAVPQDDTSAVMKIIESLAVECSINKVWTSESLAYVVDDAVQVYGGYGYSKEYPAERAFRDARITRLYEGTNEINRMIIPARLLRGSLDAPSPDKRLICTLLRTAATRYGNDVLEQQELLSHIADIAIEVYAVESARLRVAKMKRRTPIHEDIANAYAEDAAARIAQHARAACAALELPLAIEPRPPVDSIAARKRIADTVIAAGKYAL